MLDFDKVKDPDTLARMQEYFRNDPNVILCFASPSGTGIKALYNMDVTQRSKEGEKNGNRTSPWLIRQAKGISIKTFIKELKF